MTRLVNPRSIAPGFYDASELGIKPLPATPPAGYNCWQQFKKAFDLIKSQQLGGVTIFLPSGHYPVFRPKEVLAVNSEEALIQLPGECMLVGAGASTVIMPRGADCFQLPSTNGGLAGIKHLSISGNSEDGMFGFAAVRGVPDAEKDQPYQEAQHVILEGLSIELMSYGVRLENVRDVTIRSCKITNVWGGIWLGKNARKILVTENNLTIDTGLFDPSKATPYVLKNSPSNETYRFGIRTRKNAQPMVALALTAQTALRRSAVTSGPEKPESIKCHGNLIFGFDACIQHEGCNYGTYQANDLYAVYCGIEFWESFGGLTIDSNYIEFINTDMIKNVFNPEAPPCVGILGRRLPFSAGPEINCHITISGNTVNGQADIPRADPGNSNSGPKTAAFGIYIQEEQTFCRIIGNQININSVSAGTADSDIRLEKVSHFWVKDNMCKSLPARHAGEQASLILNFCSHGFISNNVFYGATVGTGSRDSTLHWGENIKGI